MKAKIVKLKSDKPFIVKVKQTEKDRKERRVRISGYVRTFRTALHEWSEVEILLHRDIEVLKNENIKLKSEIERAYDMGGNDKFLMARGLVKQARLEGARELADKMMKKYNECSNDTFPSEEVMGYIQKDLAEMEKEQDGK
jgi:hypothetical protein